MLLAGPNANRGGGPAGRLADFGRVATLDADEAADAIGRIFCPHDLKPLRGQSQSFYAAHNSAPFGGFSINYVSYGGSVLIDPGCLERFFLVQLPIAGTARIQTALCDVATAPGTTASLLSPTLPTRMVWDGNCAQLILFVERHLVEQRAAALAGKSIRSVEFDPGIDLSVPSASRLQAYVSELVNLAERLGPGRGLPPIAAAHWREALLDCLLNNQRHNLTDAVRLFTGRADRVPRSLLRARDYLHAHAAEPLDLQQLALEAGIGIRALQVGFRKFFDQSVSQMLLNIRLVHLHARLSAEESDVAITDIGLDLGFTHLSRMAGAYRAKFGEMPSATRRRACGCRAAGKQAPAGVRN